MFRFGSDTVLIVFPDYEGLSRQLVNKDMNAAGFCYAVAYCFNTVTVRHICVFHFFHFGETVGGDCAGSGWNKAAFMGTG